MTPNSLNIYFSFWLSVALASLHWTVSCDIMQGAVSAAAEAALFLSSVPVALRSRHQVTSPLLEYWPRPGALPFPLFVLVLPLRCSPAPAPLLCMFPLLFIYTCMLFCSVWFLTPMSCLSCFCTGLLLYPAGAFDISPFEATCDVCCILLPATGNSIASMLSHLKMDPTQALCHHLVGQAGSWSSCC